MRGYSPQRVDREIRWNRDTFGAEVLWFFDDTFNYNRERTEELCRLIIREKLGIRFVAELRIDVLTYDLLALMREAGVQYISFGVEAGSERVRRDIIHKNISNDQVFQAVDWAGQLDIQATAFFIFSHPTETWAEAQGKPEDHRPDQGQGRHHRIHPAHLPRHRAGSLRPGKEAAARRLLLVSRHDRRVDTLPAAQGDVPLFKEQFTWAPDRRADRLLLRLLIERLPVEENPPDPQIGPVPAGPVPLLRHGHGLPAGQDQKETVALLPAYS